MLFFPTPGGGELQPGADDNANAARNTDPAAGPPTHANAASHTWRPGGYTAAGGQTDTSAAGDLKSPSETAAAKATDANTDAGKTAVMCLTGGSSRKTPSPGRHLSS